MAYLDGTRWTRESELLPWRAPTVASERRLGRLRNLVAATVIGTALAASIIPSGPAGASRPAFAFVPPTTAASTGETKVVAAAVASPALTMTALTASTTPTVPTTPNPPPTPTATATFTPARTAAPTATAAPTLAPPGVSKPAPTPARTAGPTPTATARPTPAPTAARRSGSR